MTRRQIWLFLALAVVFVAVGASFSPPNAAAETVTTGAIDQAFVDGPFVFYTRLSESGRKEGEQTTMSEPQKCL